MPAHQPQDLHTLFASALNTGDPDALASLYEDNASLVFDGGVVQGVAAIRAAFSNFLAVKPQIDLQTMSVVQGASDLALLEGRWTLTGTAADGTPIQQVGLTREVARRGTNGTWRYVLDDPGAGR